MSPGTQSSGPQSSRARATVRPIGMLLLKPRNQRLCFPPLASNHVRVGVVVRERGVDVCEGQVGMRLHNLVGRHAPAFHFARNLTHLDVGTSDDRAAHGVVDMRCVLFSGHALCSWHSTPQSERSDTGQGSVRDNGCHRNSARQIGRWLQGGTELEQRASPRP